MQPDDSNKIPDSFVSFVSKTNDKLHELEKRRKEQLKNIERKRKRAESRKRKIAKNNVQFAKVIFDWTKSLVESDEWKKIMDIKKRSGRPLTMSIFVWHDSWSYSLYLNTDSQIRWYRWGPGSAVVHCPTPEELAYHVQPKMLMDAYGAIKSGRIWDFIRRDLASSIDE